MPTRVYYPHNELTSARTSRSRTPKTPLSRSMRSSRTSRLPLPTLRRPGHSRTSRHVYPPCPLASLTLYLQVSDVGNAHPEIFKAIDTSLTKGKWSVPGELHVYYLRTTQCLTRSPRLQREVRQPLAHVDKHWLFRCNVLLPTEPMQNIVERGVCVIVRQIERSREQPQA